MNVILVIRIMDEMFKKILNKLHLVSLIIINSILLFLRRYPKVIASHESINLIIEKRLSVSRFGDGEMMIVRGAGWGFQQYDNELAKRLIEVLKSNEPNIAICIPDVFKDRSRFTNPVKQFWYNHLLNNLYHWNKYTIKNKYYYDTQITRFYMDMEDKGKFPEKSLDLLRKIWENENLLIVEGTGSRLGYKNDLFENAMSIKRILCPPENAFNKYAQILEVSEKHAKDKLVLIALGMTATVLAYDLARHGFWALDIGHIDIEYEWYKMKAIRKVPVKHKYMNEVSIREFDEITDEGFKNQIITEVR